jgi:hypothetical protein
VDERHVPNITELRGSSLPRHVKRSKLPPGSIRKVSGIAFQRGVRGRMEEAALEVASITEELLPRSRRDVNRRRFRRCDVPRCVNAWA